MQWYLPIINLRFHYYHWIDTSTDWRGRRGRDRMVVRSTTTCAITAYHHRCCEFESRSGEVYNIMW